MARSLSQLFYALGGSVSPGKSNDELIDHLIDAEFIRTPAIQRVFRSVDRGNYYHPNHRPNAYKDIAWRMGNLHLSAPCVYSVVMETLKLKPGLSFLNLGSGSGYLSTMAGLLLGQYGINHGIEYHEDIVEYAYEKLDEFLKNSKVVDEHDFCEPVFTCGNCLTLDNNVQQYDRVYCGAACPVEYEGYIKNLVKINGILIMPLNDKLLKITRVNETVWTTVKVLSVSFAPLIPPPSVKKGEDTEHAKLGDIKPPSLQHLCRLKVRAHLRTNIETEHPKLIDNRKKLPVRKNLKLFIVNCGASGDGDSENSDSDDPENYDSFSLMMRSLHRTSYLLRSFSTQVDSVSSNEQNEESDEGVEEIADEVLKFASLTTIPDATEEEVDSSEKEEGSNVVLTVKSLTEAIDHAKLEIDSLSNSEKEAKCVTKTEKEGRVKVDGESSSKVKKEVKNNTKSGPKASSSKIKKETTVDSETLWGSIKSKDNNLEPSTSSGSSLISSYDLDLPPSHSTRSRTNSLKRKHSSLNDNPGPSTASNAPPSKKMITKKSIQKKKTSNSSKLKKQTTDETFDRAVKLDSNNKVLEEFSHTYYLTLRIAALPLPSTLRNYLNYKRDNF